MNDETEMAWRLMKENLDYCRHLEGQRQQVTTIVCSISAACLTVVGFDRSLGSEDVPLATLLFGLGLFGAVVCAKHTERSRLYYRRAREYRDLIDKALPNAHVLEAKKKADDAHRELNPRLSQTALGSLWVFLHLLVSVIAAALLFVIVAK